MNLNIGVKALSCAIALAISTTSGAPALAAPVDLTQASAGYTYYNRPRADLATHNADVADCVAIAAGLRVPEYQGVGLVGAIMTGAQGATQAQSIVENCMLVRGWRVVRLPDLEGRMLAKLETGALAEHLESWVGAQEPHGEIVRVFANDAARGDTIKIGARKYLGQHLLSIMAIDLKTVKPIAPPKWIRKLERSPAWTTNAITPEMLPIVSRDSAIVLIEVVSENLNSGLAVWRFGPNDTTSAFDTDGRPETFYPTPVRGGAKDDKRISIFAIPPGTWRIDSMGGQLSFCFGAPSFEAHAGDVLFLGQFDLTSESIGPNMSLDLARPLLNSAPAISNKLKSAIWTNGALSPCRLVYTYALELPGVAFKPDYVWGGAAITQKSR